MADGLDNCNLSTLRIRKLISPARPIDRRNLHGLELLYYLFDRSTPINICVIVELSNSVEEKSLRFALDAIQKTYWQLRTRIEDDSSPAFVIDQFDPIPVRVVYCDGAASDSEVESELATPFLVDRAPLARVVLLWHSSEQSTLIFTFHHCPFDGFSGIRVAFEILAATKGDWVPASCESGGVSESPGAYLPPECKGLRGLRRTLVPDLGERFKEIWNKKSVHTVGPVNDTSEWRPRIIWKELDEGLMRRLILASKESAVTVQSILCAAKILAFAQSSRLHGTKRVSISSAVNIRSYLSPTCEGVMGAFFSAIITRHQVSIHDNIWTLATEVRAEISKTIAAGWPLRAIGSIDLMLKLFWPWLNNPKHGGRRLQVLTEMLAPHDVMVSNIGVVNGLCNWKDINPRSVHFVVGGPPDWTIGSTAATFNGRCRWNFIYSSSRITTEAAEELSESAVQNLVRAVSG